MNLKKIFKGIGIAILCFVIYMIIFTLLFGAESNLLDLVVNTFDLDGDTMFGGIEETEEKEYWFNRLVGGSGHIGRALLIAPMSGLLTLLTLVSIVIIKHKKILKIAIFWFLLYYILVTLYFCISEIIYLNDRAFFTGIKDEWEFWLWLIVSPATVVLFYSQILTCITLIIILAIDTVKNKKKKDLALCKGIGIAILCFVIWFIILSLLVVAKSNLLDLVVNTFDRNGDGIFGGIEETEEQQYWVNRLVGGPGDIGRTLLIGGPMGGLLMFIGSMWAIFLLPQMSGLLTLLTLVSIVIIKQKKILKIAIFWSFLYYILVTLYSFISAIKANEPAFFGGVKGECEYWLWVIFPSIFTLLYSQILTCITLIIILVIDTVKNKKDLAL